MLNNIESINYGRVLEIMGMLSGSGFTKFDKKLNRLGYGGGYYDKLLSIYPDTLKIGFTFNERIIEDIPTENHDISMDYVFTNDKYYKSEI